jgi:hypothetical protein
MVQGSTAEESEGVRTLLVQLPAALARRRAVLRLLLVMMLLAAERVESALAEWELGRRQRHEGER